MEEPKKYRIDSFEKLCNVVNDDNIGTLAIDLAQWLIFYNSVISKIRKERPDFCKGKTNWQISESEFTFINDGKNDFVGFTSEIKETGEQITIKKS